MGYMYVTYFMIERTGRGERQAATGWTGGRQRQAGQEGGRQRQAGQEGGRQRQAGQEGGRQRQAGQATGWTRGYITKISPLCVYGRLWHTTLQCGLAVLAPTMVTHYLQEAVRETQSGNRQYCCSACRSIYVWE